MTRHVVKNLLTQIEGTFDNVGDKPIETVFEIENELSDRLVAEVEDAIGDALNAVIVTGEYEELDTVLGEAVTPETIRRRIWDYFETFAAADVYEEILRIQSTLRFRDNFESYLYIGEIHYENHAFPLFYVPVQVSLEGTEFTIGFDPHLFINKKAVDYVAQEVARQHDERAPTLVEDRIKYLEPEQRPRRIMQGLLDRWVPSFQVSGAVDFSLEREQKAQSALVAVTNRLQLAAFDKSDESLLNDYEALLTMTEGGEEVVEDFRELVHGFLFTDPIGERDEVEIEWENKSVPDRLVYRSPIPLNEEQRKILSAIKRPNCKFIAVQGPPGTGKSHTITAMAFDTILAGQNVLILSDKTEALDVAEAKLIETLNDVRVSEDFQNPILRLGRQANTYSKILSNQTIEKIRSHYRATKSREEKLESEVRQSEQSLKAEVQELIETYREIEMPSLVEIERQESDLDELFSNDISDALADDAVVLAIEDILALGKLIGGEPGISVELLKLLAGLDRIPAIEDLEQALKLIPVLAKFDFRTADESEAVGFFRAIRVADIANLAGHIRQYQTIRLPLFGFLFTRKKARELDAAFAGSFSVRSQIDIYKRLDLLQLAITVFDRLAAHLAESIEDDDALLPAAHRMLPSINQQNSTNYSEALDRISRIRGGIELYPVLEEKFGLSADDVLGWSPNQTDASADRVRQLEDFIHKYRKMKTRFDAIPKFDYEGRLAKLEALNTQKLANIIDGRIVTFADQQRNTAQEIRSIIRRKQRFPHDKFDELKKAFPCIIAGIRDFAEYVPLEPQLFDLLIIDEASQVSIAQAFPAILRAKKVVVLGDHHQFSNVKTSNASLATNQQYLSDLIAQFSAEFSAVSGDLERLRKFNIKHGVRGIGPRGFVKSA